MVNFKDEGWAMNSEGELWAAIIFWIALVYGVFVLVVFPAYESVFMTTGYYKASSCSSSDANEVCYRSLLKTAVSKGRQFIVIKADGESPKKLERCAVFSKSEWECADYLLLANGVIGSTKVDGSLRTTVRLEPVWPTTYLYHWARDTWSGCYAGQKHQRLTLLDTQGCIDAFDLLIPAPPAE